MAFLSHALQIQLFEGAAKGIAVSWEDQYDTAIAYLAEGFCSRRPQHVRTALKLLGSVKSQTELGTGPADIGEFVHSSKAAQYTMHRMLTTSHCFSATGKSLTESMAHVC